MGASVAAAPASAATQTANALFGRLTVAAPVLSGYDRALFGTGWDDADHDGCDTRAEVLQVETIAPVTYSNGCTVATGQWTSAYDGVTWTSASDVDVDHMVPLGEAWASGASTWTADRRVAYANDLGYPGALNAVTSSVNQSKGDQDISQWLPPLASDQCQYAVDWVAVKWRWDQSIDETEQSALTSLLGTNGCGDTAVDITKADVTPPPPPPPPAPSDHLTAGQTLAAGARLFSAGGAYTLVVQTDGNAVVYRTGGGASFNTATSGNPGARLALQTDGNLVVYSSTGRALWHNSASAAGVVLRMQDDGNLVEYGPTAPLWSSKGGLIRPPAPPPPPVTGPTLYPGQTMRAGQMLTDGGYRLSLQADGNLVEYASTGRVVWQARTSGHAGATLTMQGDGNAVLYAGGRAWFSTGTSGHPGARITLGTDGNVVVYATNGTPLFRTGADPGPGGGGVQSGIIPGAYCSPPGAPGISSAGNHYLCAYYSTDGRYHWKRI